MIGHVLRSLALLLLMTGVAMSQNTRTYLVIEPAGSASNGLQVKSGVPVQFAAKAYQYTNNGNTVEVPITNVTWSVYPVDFGTISSTGLFTASGKAPQGTINAEAPLAGVMLSARVLARLDPNTGGNFDYSISGSVTDASSNPVPGADIFAQNPNLPMTVGYSARTDASGNYTVKIPAGTYIAGAAAKGFLHEYYDDKKDINKADRIQTDPSNKHITGIDYVLSEGGSISGTVLDATQNTPVKGASVIAFGDRNSTGGPGNPGNVAVTDAHGKYEIKGLAGGKYFVMAESQTHELQFYDHVKALTQADEVSVAEGMNASGIDFDLDRKIIVPPNPYWISGVVRDGSGNGIAHATVVAESSMTMDPAGRRHYARTDSSGNYRIDLPGGAFVVQASATGFLPMYYDNVKTRGNATQIQLDNQNQSKTDVDFALPSGGKITGIVQRASDNTPLENAWVFVGNGPNTNPGGQNGYGARTDAQGQYTITGLPTGEYIVAASANGYEQQYYDGVADPTQASKVNVTENQTTGGIDFNLNKLSGISGTVLDASNSQAVVQAQVRVTDLTRNLKLHAYTGRNGEYHVNVPAGTYTVEAGMHGYATEWYNEKSDASQADPVTVAGGASVDNINFTLDRWGGSISGHVYDDSNNPIEKAIVLLWGGRDPSTAANVAPFGHALTDASGYYQITGVAPGSHYVVASATGVVPEFYDNVPDISQATKVNVVNNQNTPGIDFSLARGGSISGKVVDDSTSAPIANAYVGIRGKVSLSAYGVRTDGNGDYTISGLHNGDYLVYASAYKYRGEYFNGVFDASNATPVSVTAPNTTADIDFALERISIRTHRFTGSVVDAASRTSISTAIVEVIDPVSGDMLFTSTNEYGTFEVDTDANSIVRARALNYIGQYAGDNRNWEDGKASSQQGQFMFALQPQPQTGFATVLGTVRDMSSGAPVAGAFVYGEDEYGNGFFACTNEDGKFRMDGVSEGAIDLTVSGVQYEAGQSGVQVNGVSGSAALTLRHIDTPTGTENPVDRSFMLAQNYPNPFRQASFTTIPYSIDGPGHITLKVFNMLGREVAILVDDYRNAGAHTVLWTPADLPAGVYMYRIESAGKVQMRRMSMMK